MNTDDFWSLIERAQQVADPQNEASMMEALFWELTKLPDREFFAWYRLQEAFMQLADTPKLCAAASIINYGTSDDRFMDFCAWLVMQGRAVYLSALAAPDRLARMRVPFGEAESGSSAGISPCMLIPAESISHCSDRTPPTGRRCAAAIRIVRICRSRWSASA